MAERPVLAICVPTHGRAAALEALLRTLAADPDVRRERPPVLVSDNASPDDTAARVRRLRDELPELDLRLHAQPENVGFLRNFAWLIEHAPVAEHLWLLGDDDVPRPGAVGEVLRLLAAERPRLLHLPHTFESGGRVFAASPCPPAPETFPSSRELLLAYTRWPSFISSCVVRRDEVRRALREAPTDNPFGPYVWYALAGREGPCVVAAQHLVAGGPVPSWSAERVTILTARAVACYDDGLSRVVDAEGFGRILDGHYRDGDSFDCWAAQPLELLAGAVTRFPASRELRRNLWTLARRHGRADLLGPLDAAAVAAGAAEAAARLVKAGEERFAAGDLAGAAGAFEAAVDARPTWATAWNDLGVARHALRRPEALEAFTVALELEPGSADALLNRALYLAEHGRATEAAGDARRLLALQPGHADAAQLLATVAAG